jgi:transposase
MGTSFRPYEPEQSHLFPASPRDWLPEGHLAFFISDTVESLELNAFYERYKGDGRRNQPFDPAMMLKVLLYGYSTGTFSSRRLAAKLEEDVAYRYLAGGCFPAHRTIAEFRQRHLAEFGSLFVQVVRLAREVGLVKLGTLVLDGTKVKANASKHKAMSYERMRKEEERLVKEIKAITTRAAQEDAAEDAEFGPDFRGDELPEELARRESRLAKIRAAKARLEQRQREEDRRSGRGPGDHDKPGRSGPKFKRRFGTPPDKKQDNFTDPDSRIMKTGQGYQQSYNAQAAIEDGTQLIVATGLTQSAADTRELKPLLERVQTNTGRLPKRSLADAGYLSEENLRHLEEVGVTGYVALGREKKDGPRRANPEYPATQRMRRRLRTRRGRAYYRRRKQGERPFGWIKSVLGFASFSLRGVTKAAAEWDLVCLALNLKRLNHMMVWQ